MSKHSGLVEAASEINESFGTGKTKKTLDRRFLIRRESTDKTIRP